MCDATRLSPGALGVAIAGTYIALRTGVFAAFPAPGGSPALSPAFWEHPVGVVELINAALIGYVPFAMVYGLRAAQRDLADLRPVLTCSEARCEELARELGATDWRLRCALVTVFAVGSGLIPILDPRVRPAFGALALSDPLMLFVIARHALIGWLVGEVLALDVAVTRRFSRVGELSAVDLLDLTPLAPFGRRGLRTALLYLLGLCIVSLFWLTPYAGTLNAGLVVFWLVLATGFFVLPVRGVHLRILEVKRAELEEVRARIRSDRLALRESGTEGARNAALRLPADLASEARLQAVREWPFDATTLLRFGLYLALGLGSWLGGAVVERLLGAALE